MSTIKVYEVIGKNAISMKSGDKIYQLIIENINKKEKTILDFEEVDLFASPFFNTAIGHLLKDMELHELQDQLKFENLDGIGKDLLNLVISNALNFYKKG
ncbi:MULTISPECIES: STAS-like domain-containing protein [Acinetobacter calcoaceticus/baumannii complex]|uniref:STAS-like domain-containing protein n=1 Tax=Acinetobacter calcoaceticus/baumannii complex TaxID=909768 RepID=UPI00238084CE|nr:STAS-like domain-containing protein [Acinetobacter pittii]MDE4038334.1 STAS-like domain-containing protein [Acinetobacter pittii]WPP88997.1 STAS-like domain-containing protein [Acinetobacter pittii]